VAWGAVAAAIGFDALKCILLVAFAVFFSALSTSFFLPVFGTIAIYLVGGASQQAYDYVQSAAGQTLAPLVRQLATGLYYLCRTSPPSISRSTPSTPSTSTSPGCC
jgi:membrane glycosyltransferase